MCGLNGLSTKSPFKREKNNVGCFFHIMALDPRPVLWNRLINNLDDVLYIRDTNPTYWQTYGAGRRIDHLLPLHLMWFNRHQFPEIVSERVFSNRYLSRAVIYSANWLGRYHRATVNIGSQFQNVSDSEASNTPFYAFPAAHSGEENVAPFSGRGMVSRGWRFP